MNHVVSYKGYKIYCSYYMYYIEGYPGSMYLTFNDAKAEVDSIVKQSEENLIDVKSIVQQNRIS